MAPDSFSAATSSQVRPSSSSTSSVCSPSSGARVDLDGLPRRTAPGWPRAARSGRCRPRWRAGSRWRRPAGRRRARRGSGTRDHTPEKSASASVQCAERLRLERGVEGADASHLVLGPGGLVGEARSSASSGRPRQAHSSGKNLSDCNRMRLMNRSSAVRYTLTSGLALSVRSPCGIFENPNSFDATTSGDTCHMAVASSEQSTTAPSPVRSRCTRAAAMPPAVAMPRHHVAERRRHLARRPPAVASRASPSPRRPGPSTRRRRSRPCRRRAPSGPDRCRGRRRCRACGPARASTSIPSFWRTDGR